MLLRSFRNGTGSSKPSRVVRTGTNYNIGARLKALESLLRRLSDPTASAERPAAVASPRRARRLTEEEKQAIAEAYQTGAKAVELAARYGVARQTVSRILKKQGIQTRWHRMSAEQIDEAEQLYGQGWSLNKLSERFGVDASTVRGNLVERGGTYPR